MTAHVKPKEKMSVLFGLVLGVGLVLWCSMIAAGG